MKEGGGKFKAQLSASVVVYSASIRGGDTNATLYVMKNGVFVDAVFSKKFYLDYNKIKDVYVEDRFLVVITLENELEVRTVLRFLGISLKKAYFKIRENAGLEYKEPDLSFTPVEIPVSKRKARKVEEKERVRELKREHVPYCPKCKSTSIQYVEHRKKLSIGRAVVGGVVAGAPGAVLGGLTSKKYKGNVKCLNCGHEWKI